MEEFPIRAIIFVLSILATGVSIYAIVKVWKTKHLRETLRIDTFASINYTLWILFIFSFMLYHTLYFITDVKAYKSQGKDLALRSICNKDNSDINKFIMLEVFKENAPQITRSFANMCKLLNLHLFHCMVFNFITMLVALIVHKTLLQDLKIKNMFSEEDMQERKFDLIIKREEQNRLTRIEKKLIGTYITLLFFIILMFLGFLSSQIIDVDILSNESNVYKINSVLCHTSDILK